MVLELEELELELVVVLVLVLVLVAVEVAVRGMMSARVCLREWRRMPRDFFLGRFVD